MGSLPGWIVGPTLALNSPDAPGKVTSKQVDAADGLMGRWGGYRRTRPGRLGRTPAGSVGGRRRGLDLCRGRRDAAQGQAWRSGRGPDAAGRGARGSAGSAH